MSFLDIANSYEKFPYAEFFAGATPADVLRALSRERLTEKDFLILLSPAAAAYLEPMAQKAHRLTVRHFGHTIVLYAPLYLSNYCINQCSYCNFNARHRIRRKTLTLAEVDREGDWISRRGLRHLLLLTGESRRHAPLSYIETCVELLQPRFPALGLEIYPLTVAEYERLAAIGVDNLTIYQEVYDPEIYAAVHLKGPKKDYRFRLEAPERAAAGGIRTVNIGALLGLGGSWRREAFLTGLHAAYLQDSFPATEISVSLPRLRPNVGNFQSLDPVGDRDLVQILLAMRLYLPRAGLTLSTREAADFRDNLLPLGITKLSAGSSTEVGGYSLEEEEKGDGQFELADHRDVAAIQAMLLARGYQPVFKDWYSLQEPAAGPACTSEP